MGKTAIIIGTIVLRLLAATAIVISPIIGMIASLFLDWFDSYLLIQRAGITRKQYHTIDKNIDQIWSLVMLGVGIFSPYKTLLVRLFVFRLIGHGIYSVTHNTRVFLFFPNVFEFVFLWFVALSPWLSRFNNRYFWLVFSALFVLKVAQEYVLHWFWPAYLLRMKKKHVTYTPLLRFLGWKRLGI